MKALAVIPWQSPDPWRIRLMRYVTDHLEKCGVESYLSPDPNWIYNHPFNRARAKNDGAAIAVAAHYDTIIFHDADMLLHDWEYATLIDRAEDSGKLVIGYNEYRPLTQAGTAWLLDGQISDPWQATYGDVLVGWSLGGIIAITVDAFKEVGGYDERFRGWGCEDTAFAIACGVALDGKQRLDESTVHLWHPPSSLDQKPEDNEFNAALLKRYNEVTSVEDLRRVQTTD